MAEARVAATRNQTVEALRIISAFGIVVFHAKAPGAAVGYAGLIVFVAMAMMFDTLDWNRRRSAASLAMRLLVPFAFWSMIYGLKNLAVDHRVFTQDGPLPLNLIAGTAGHLWFLPFIFLALVIDNAIKPHLGRTPFFAIMGVLAVAMLATEPMWRPLILPVPLPQWLHAATAAFVGAAIGSQWERRRWLATVLALLAAGIALALRSPGVSDAYPVGLVALVVALWLPSLKFNVEPVSRCMMGVYLAHIAVLSVVARRFSVDSLAVAFAVFAACTAGVYVARRFVPATRWVLG